MIKIIEGVLQKQKNYTNTNSHLHCVSDTKCTGAKISMPPTRQSLLAVQHLFLVGWGRWGKYKNV